MLSAVIYYKHSYSTMLLVKQSIHQRFTFPGPLVLRFNSLNFLDLSADRDQIVLRRSKLRSCTTLLGEQPNPWNHFQFQDVIIQHRGAKPLRRYGLLGVISLLSPAYLLFDERWSFPHRTTGSL